MELELVYKKNHELIKELQSLQPIPKERQEELDKKFRLLFNYHSNSLEGNTLTQKKTELSLIFDDDNTKGNHPIREYEEMKAPDVAYHLVKEWAKDKEHSLTEQDIIRLNELVRPFWADALPTLPPVGPLKNTQELIAWYHKEEKKQEYTVVVLASKLHYEFVRIYPLKNGNGRTARLLMNYALLKNDLPPVVIKSEERERKKYYDVAQYERKFVPYIAEQLNWSLETYIKEARGKV